MAGGIVLRAVKDQSGWVHQGCAVISEVFLSGIQIYTRPWGVYWIPAQQTAGMTKREDRGRDVVWTACRNISHAGRLRDSEDVKMHYFGFEDFL